MMKEASPIVDFGGYTMQRKSIFIVLAAAAAGIALGFFAERGMSPARAGGLTESSPRNTYVTSSQDGDVLYEWNVGARLQVVRYAWSNGSVLRQDLRAPEGEKAPPRKEPGTGEEGPEIVISGVIWTPNAETRVAIINGKSVREGETFQTRSGKKYKVVEIKKTEEVETVEVK
jgi:hypothetical protein